MRTFRSDNNAGLCPEALEAIRHANDASHRMGYGDDVFTLEAQESFREIFGNDTAVFFVATGTAGNVLSIASLTDVWQRVVCHRHSHFNEDESTAPERVVSCRVTTVSSDPCKVTSADVQHVGDGTRGDVHEPAPGVVTLSNATEFGTVYSVEELRDICSAAHAAGFRVHVDGARFANAVASLGCDPRALSIEAGVDALTFGGTKNGLALGEAVLFFPQGDGSAYRRAVRNFEFQRKSTGHLLSKHRFVSAPFTATLKNGAWLGHAAHANEMARRLEAGLRELQIEPLFPVQANGVFVRLPENVGRALKARGHGYYPFGNAETRCDRLLCSFDTTEQDVDSFLACAREATHS